MKFQCPQCKKEFSLETSRLQPGVVRVRCTSCGSVIKMRIGGGAAAQPPDAKSSDAPSAQYWAVIGQSKVGPMPFVALKRLIQEQKVTRSTLLWNKSLPTWTRASHIPDVAALLPKDASGESSGPRPLPRSASAEPSGPRPIPSAQPLEALLTKMPAPVEAPAPILSQAPVVSAPVPSVSAPVPSVSAPAPSVSAPPPPRPVPEPVVRLAEPPAAQPPAAKPPLPPAPPPRRPSPVPGAQASTPAEEEEPFFPAPPLPADAPPRAAGKPSAQEEAFFPSPNIPSGPSRSGRSFESLDIPDNADFTVKVEEGQARGAHESLRDFSMMVRLSAESRKRTIMVVVGLILFALLAVGVVVLVANSGRSGATTKNETEEEFIEAASDFSKAAVTPPTSPASQDIKSEKAVAPSGGSTIELNPTALIDPANENMEFQFAMGADSPETAEIQIKTVRSGGTKVAKKEGSTATTGQEEVTLAQLAADSAQGATAPKTPVDLAAASAERAKNPDKEVEVVPEAASKVAPTGTGLVRSVKIALGKRLRGSRKTIQTCASRFGLAGTQVRMNMHIADDGTVSSIAIDGVSEDAENCILAAFQGWSIPEVTRRLLVPITLSF